MAQFSFQITGHDSKSRARTGIISTAHGTIQTPAFVPVGTQASLKSLDSADAENLGIQMFFVNTYHMYLRPGIDVVRKTGGLHRFMDWHGPLITDSGGFQAYSLGRRKFVSKDSGLSTHVPVSLSKVTEDGVAFQSHWDGSHHVFSAESSMEYQWDLGSDIHIAFDDCTPFPVTYEYARRSMDRTHRWATRSLSSHKSLSKKRTPYQALYGVVQGSVYEDLRKESAGTIADLDVDGIAIGGVSVGESKKQMKDVLTWVNPHLPDTKPRHLLGVGEIDDIFTLVDEGIDTFDCVQPTRLARMGHIFFQKSKIKNQKSTLEYMLDITNKIYAESTEPLDPGCSCFVCKRYTRAYIHHLFRTKELAAYRLATYHNVYFVERLVSHIRDAITSGEFIELKKIWV